MTGAECGADWLVKVVCSWGTEGSGRIDLPVWDCTELVADGGRGWLCCDVEAGGCVAVTLHGSVALLVFEVDAAGVVVLLSVRKAMDG
jgi:hypothetical protein